MTIQCIQVKRLYIDVAMTCIQGKRDPNSFHSMCPALTQHKSKDSNINDSMTGSRETLKVRDVRLNVPGSQQCITKLTHQLLLMSLLYHSTCSSNSMQTIYYSRNVFTDLLQTTKKFICENLTTKQTTPFACNRCGLLHQAYTQELELACLSNC